MRGVPAEVGRVEGPHQGRGQDGQAQPGQGGAGLHGSLQVTRFLVFRLWKSIRVAEPVLRIIHLYAITNCIFNAVF